MIQMEYATSCPQDLEEKRVTSVNRASQCSVCRNASRESGEMYLADHQIDHNRTRLSTVEAAERIREKWMWCLWFVRYLKLQKCSSSWSNDDLNSRA